MHLHSSRRSVLRVGTWGALAAAGLAGVTPAPAPASPPGGAGPPAGDGDAAGLWPGFPRQDQKFVAELVGAAHFNEARVKELVRACPELVNASWDWGFGDWETPLGAASHTGQRAIAEFLLGDGARIDIFAAAMLGWTDVVKALVAARPGVQRTLGPHGIPLLAHARAGGPPAEDTAAYLAQLGDAGTGIPAMPLAAEDRQKYLGEFVAARARVKLVCRLNRSDAVVIDVRSPGAESNNRMIQYAGDDEFFPSGVPSVRIRFTLEQGKAIAVTLRGSVPEITLRRGGE